MTLQAPLSHRSAKPAGGMTVAGASVLWDHVRQGGRARGQGPIAAQVRVIRNRKPPALGAPHLLSVSPSLPKLASHQKPGLAFSGPQPEEVGKVQP